MARQHRSPVLTLLAAALLAAGPLVATGTPAEAAVRTCTSSTPVTSRPTVQRGDTGSCVKVAQQALLAKGYSVGLSGANADFGPDTLAATKAFQREYGLPVDGVIGRTTWVQLGTGPAYSRTRGPNYTSRVVLTYDDCPKTAAAFTAMVQEAKRLDVGLVIAPTGDCITRFKASDGIDLAATARANGQYVINHSVSHPYLTKTSYSSMLTQLRAPGVVTNFGRPPYGATNSLVSKAYTAAGMRQWTWSLSTVDWSGKTTDEVVDYVIANSRPGYTMLLHMQWNAFNPSALRRMKAGLADRGLLLCNAADGTAPARLPRSLPCTA